MKGTLRTIASITCLQTMIFSTTPLAISAVKSPAEENLQQLITTRSCRQCDLAGLDLTRLNLSGVDLQGADLSHTKLSLANLSGANLKNTLLNNAVLGGTDLEGADLRGAQLQGTSLDDAYLGDAILDQPTALTDTNNQQSVPAASAAKTVSSATTDSAEIESTGWWSSQPKSKKMLYTSVAAATAIGIWGLATWDYGTAGFTMGHEHWFGQDTKYGGADKCGHFWSTYAFADALTGLYKSWGYAPKKANLYAAISSWTVQFAMELGDATSVTQGFSWEDMTMNTLGALTSVLMERYPEIDRKIDFRVEYVFNKTPEGIFDDYFNQFYSVVLKLDGFDSVTNPILQYVELSAGYYTRGYGIADEENTRSIFAGIGFNFSRLLEQHGWEKTGKVLEYIQLPYTVPKVSHQLD